MTTTRSFTIAAMLAAAVMLGAACGSDDGEGVAVSGVPGGSTVAAGDEAHDHTDDHADDHAPDMAEMDGTRTVKVTMTEFAFAPESFEVAAGDTVRFVFRNDGAIEHEAMLGDAHMQEEFMEGHTGHGGGHHGDLEAVTVPAGESAELVVTFDEPGTTYFGCHLPGHYEAGMEASLDVV